MKEINYCGVKSRKTRQLVIELQQENENLKHNLSEYVNVVLHDRKEIDRLNNIINELQQWLEKLIDNFDDNVSEATLREQFVITYVYDYLKQLKEE